MFRSSLRAAILVAATVALTGPAAAEGDLHLETLSGEPEMLSLAQGERALVVHFWATWCRECVEELPVLAKAVPSCAGSGIRIVAVNVGEDRGAIERFLAPLELDLTVLRDPRGQVWRRVSGIGLPTNLTWTSEGREVEAGPRDAATWRRILGALGCRDPGSASPARGSPTVQSGSDPR